MKNIIIASAGGKGEVLTFMIINDAAYYSNLDFKSYGALGLNKRNGIVALSVRIGKDIQCPLIPVGSGDIMIGLEPLEAYRQSYYLKKSATIILNNYRIYPSICLTEEEKYPSDIYAALSSEYNVIPYNFFEVVKKVIGNKGSGNYRIRTSSEFIPNKIMIANSFCLGIFANLLKDIIPLYSWKKSFEKNISKAVLAENIDAFNLGLQYASHKKPSN